MKESKLWCFFGVHEYETVEKGPYTRTSDMFGSRSGAYYILRCKKCGIVKRKVMV